VRVWITQVDEELLKPLEKNSGKAITSREINVMTDKGADLFHHGTRDILHMRSLENMPNHYQLPYKMEVLMMPNMQLVLQPLKAPMPHGNRRQFNPKGDTLEENIRPSSSDQLKWGIHPTKPKVNFVSTNHCP